MYNFTKEAERIIKEGSNYGVKIAHSGKKLGFSGTYRGSSAIEKALTRKINTYNSHVDQGF